MLPIKYYSVIQLLNAIATSDGNISSSEDKFIWVAGAKLNFTRGRLETIKNQFVKVKTKSKEYDHKTLQFLALLGLKRDLDRSGYNL
tara:strand:+ start:375 stop:635 length:261 start_codon:yes stop_codon:yes gene_type:complete